MQLEDQLFTSLIYLFQSAGMQGLGKILNPASNKIEKNMDQAKQSIEMLEMLKKKTQGNLSDELSRFLDASLTDLRLNYVDELKESK